MVKIKAKMAIITRTKNRNLLLGRAIKSVLSQTDKDYIHVIVNDGGDISTLDELLRNYPDSNRLVIHNKKSSGLTKALNQGIRAVDTKYISILDDDDTWASSRLKRVNTFLDDNPTVPGVAVVMDRVVEKIEGEEIIEVSRNRWLDGVDTISLYKQCLDNYLSNGCFNYTRRVYDELNGYDESLNVAEDWDFGVRYLLKYDAEFLNTKKALMNYHHRPDQTGDSGNSVFSGVNTHKYNLNLLCNKYLREDMDQGRLGVGYIMNNLRYERERDEARLKSNIENTVRLEGHINLVTNDLKTDILNMMSSYEENRLSNRIEKKVRKIIN